MSFVYFSCEILGPCAFWVGLTQIAYLLFCGISWLFCLLNQWFCRILRRLRYCWRGWMFCFRHLFNRKIVKYTFIIYVDSIEVASTSSTSINITIWTRHSIAHTIFKMRRDKKNASLEIAMAEKNRNYWKNIVLVKIMC